MIKWKVILSLVFLLYISSALAQGIKVVDVKETVSGTDAFHAPIDGNNHPCGLVKILAIFSDLRFAGDVVGDVTSENNEYKVFMAKGSKQLVIKRPEVFPLVINFPDYGIEEISSKATYNIKLKEVSLNPIKNLLVMDVKPRTANVYIDDLLIDNEYGDGGYRLLLPKGDHIYRIEAKGYRTNASVVKTGKGTQTIKTELESLLADIDITCQTSGANIYVDGKNVGVGSWKGQLSAGNYTVEANLEGFLPISQSLVLEEKDNQVLNLPPLKRAKGNLSVLTNVKEAEVYLDGNLVNNPKRITDIQTGNHFLKIKAPFGYKETEQEIVIKANSLDTINIILVPINDMYARAFTGDIKAMAQICHEKIESSKYIEKDSIERNYWYDMIYENLDKIDKQSLDLICPCLCDFCVEEAPFYVYYCSNTTKGIKILQRWNTIDPENDAVVLEMMRLNLRLKNYEAVATWGARGLDICGFEGYMGWFMEYIAEACIMLGDVNRAVTIFKEHISKEYRWDKGYMAIARVYKEKGDCKNAVVYYKKYLQVHTSDIYGIEDAKEGIRDCGFR